jgi:uncharacterized membrane protein (DUF106 family)
MQEYPRISIVVVSLLVSMISTVVTKYTTDQSLLKSVKDRQKEIQKELKEKKYSPSDKIYLELHNELLSLTGKMFKNSFKPLFITMIPFLLLLYWLRSIFVPLMGNSWIWYYMIPSLFISSLWRKLFKVV